MDRRRVQIILVRLPVGAGSSSIGTRCLAEMSEAEVSLLDIVARPLVATVLPLAAIPVLCPALRYGAGSPWLHYVSSIIGLGVYLALVGPVSIAIVVSHSWKALRRALAWGLYVFTVLYVGVIGLYAAKAGHVKGLLPPLDIIIAVALGSGLASAVAALYSEEEEGARLPGEPHPLLDALKRSVAAYIVAAMLWLATVFTVGLILKPVIVPLCVARLLLAPDKNIVVLGFDTARLMGRYAAFLVVYLLTAPRKRDGGGAELCGGVLLC